MWEVLAPLLANGSTLALLGIAVARGWLVPYRWHQDRVGDLKVAIAALKDTVAEKDRQISILLGRTTL